MAGGDQFLGENEPGFTSLSNQMSLDTSHCRVIHLDSSQLIQTERRDLAGSQEGLHLCIQFLVCWFVGIVSGGIRSRSHPLILA